MRDALGFAASLVEESLKCRSLALYAGHRCPENRLMGPRYIPMHEVAPSAVTMAVATDAMICTMNLNVSLLVMVLIN